MECKLGRKYDGKFDRPANFKRMIQAVEALAEDFDLIRVDLYSAENKIYFGELTPYPGGVTSLRGFDVASMDYILGEKWKRK